MDHQERRDGILSGRSEDKRAVGVNIAGSFSIAMAQFNKRDTIPESICIVELKGNDVLPRFVDVTPLACWLLYLEGRLLLVCLITIPETNGC